MHENYVLIILQREMSRLAHQMELYKIARRSEAESRKKIWIKF